MYKFNFASDLIASHPDKAPLIFWGALILIAAVGYLLGSVNTGIILSRTVFHDDIREHGSGNAGATNMLRTHGTISGVLTLVGDALKAFCAVLLGALAMNILGAYVAGLFCIVGHIFPLYYGFRGGKGVVVTATMIACTNIRVFVIVLIIFLILVIGTKFISLGSVISAAVYPLILFKLTSASVSSAYDYVGVLIAFIIAALIVWKHRENIKRIYNHTENKISFTKKGKSEDKKGITDK